MAGTNWLPPGNPWEMRLDALGDDLAVQQIADQRCTEFAKLEQRWKQDEAGLFRDRDEGGLIVRNSVLS